MPARKKYNLVLPRRKCWNFIILQALEHQTERESCFMNHTACGQCLFVCVCVCVCLFVYVCVYVCDIYSFEQRVHLPHYYIVT